MNNNMFLPSVVAQKRTAELGKSYFVRSGPVPRFGPIGLSTSDLRGPQGPDLQLIVLVKDVQDKILSFYIKV